MNALSNSTCEHCGESVKIVFGYDGMSLWCCMDCYIHLFVFSFLPYYELWDNEELKAAKYNTKRDSLISIASKS